MIFTDARQRDFLELHNLLSLPPRRYNKGGIIERVQYLVKLYVYRNYKGSGWNVLHRQCDICKQTQPSAQELIAHRTVHTSKMEKRYTCLQCDSYATFENRRALDNHMFTLHMKLNHKDQSREKDSTKRKGNNCKKLCDICHKGFHSIKSHNYVHTGVKPHRCRMCGQRFARFYHLVVHIRTHTKEKPYKCDHCDTSFSQQSSLSQHIRIHTGEKPYPCKVCNKRFRHSVTLNLHMKTHTGEKPYECDICHKFFSQLSNMYTHKNMHIDAKQKQYKCNICNKSCSQRSNLTTHMRIHNGKPVKCAICDRNIASYYFKRHMRIIHDVAI